MGEFTEKQSKYIAARSSGIIPAQSRLQAGYNPSTPLACIEKPGGEVWKAIRANLDKKGLTDDWLVDEIKKGADEAWEKGRVRVNPEGQSEYAPSFRAHGDYIDRVIKLRGYDRVEASPAVQINQQFGQLGDYVESLEPQRVEALIGAVEAKIMEIESTEIHAGDSEAGDSQAYSEVVETAE